MRQTAKEDLFAIEGEKVIEMGRIMDAQVQTNRAIMRAADHADRASPGWADRAMVCVLNLCARNAVFTSEDARALAQTLELEAPPDPRAWGYVLKRARDLGYVRPVGFGISKLPHAHQRPVRRWEPI